MTDALPAALAPSPSLPHPTLRDALPSWLKVAVLSFGGPVGQVALMHRVVVEEKRWVSEPRFLHALNFCMLLPGPEAQQLATYLGWMMHGVRGGIIAGGLFILPGVVAILALSYLYVLLGDVEVVAAFFFGLKAAVIAIVTEALIRIARRTLTSRALTLIAAGSFAAVFMFGVPFPLIVLGAGLVGYVGGRSGWTFLAAGPRHVRDAEDGRTSAEPTLPIATPRSLLVIAATGLVLWWAPVLAVLVLISSTEVFVEIGLFFSKMALVTFGGAYAVLTYVAQYSVEGAQWLTPDQMVDGLGLAETTPGPLIMVVQFVGFLAGYHEPGAMAPLAAATIGALLATWVTFVPSFLFVLLGAPFMERLRHNEALAGALRAITAAVVGVILNLALWFALHVLFHEVNRIEAGPLNVNVPVPSSIDWAAAGLVVLAGLMIFRFKAGVLTVIAATSAIGVAVYLAWLR